MSTRENLFAFTEASGYAYYPAYISINRLADRNVGVSVRSRDATGCAEVVLAPEEFERLKLELAGVR